MRKFVFISLLVSTILSAQSQKMTREQYVSKYYKLAVQEMNLYRIPASITLAQGILETESGNSDLCKTAKNHFGIKCQITWTGMKFIKDDDAKNECFRAYAADEESFRDHSTFLQRSRYDKLFTYDMKDYKSWAYGLKEAGYATNPSYPQLLIKHIEDLQLYQFDNFGITTIEEKVAPKAIDTVKKDTAKSSVNLALKNDSLKLKNRREKANNIELIVVDSNFNVYEISSQKKIDLKSLMLYNELENEQGLLIGQNFFLQNKLNGNPINTHEVKAGQSLYDISQIYGVKVSSLRKYNKLDVWEQPAVGETIMLNSHRNNYIKTRPYYEVERERKKEEKSIANSQKIVELKEPTNPTSNNPIINNPKTTNETPISDGTKKWINHNVAPKETIFRISKLYDCKPSEILEWNGLKLEQGLTVGQSLKIFTLYPKGMKAIENVPVSTPAASKPVIVEKSTTPSGMRVERVSLPIDTTKSTTNPTKSKIIIE